MPSELPMFPELSLLAPPLVCPGVSEISPTPCIFLAFDRKLCYTYSEFLSSRFLYFFEGVCS